MLDFTLEDNFAIVEEMAKAICKVLFSNIKYENLSESQKNDLFNAAISSNIARELKVVEISRKKQKEFDNSSVTNFIGGKIGNEMMSSIFVPVNFQNLERN